MKRSILLFIKTILLFLSIVACLILWPLKKLYDLFMQDILKLILSILELIIVHKS